MRAVRATDTGIEAVDIPAPTGEGVRVHMRSAGICGSDLHMIGTPLVAGRILGHEVAGVLDDGRAVAVEPLAPCTGCETCRRGDYNLCAESTRAMVGVFRDGGMAEELVVPAACLVPLPTGIPVEEACLIEPLAVVVHGLRRAGFVASQRVAVIGGGNIGLCAVAAAVHAGAEVGLEARHDAQIEAGERLGARPLSGHYDLVIECAGTESALARGIELSRPGGRMMLLAAYWGGFTLPGLALSAKEVDVIPSWMYGREGAMRDFEVAAALLAGQPELGATLIRHRYPLEGAVEAFEKAADRKAGAIKVVLEP
ncbi:MAG: alcohol dehydrogenase catalytic domain-containing protein [Myxococcota bacterium]|nr:alcohol dehydrogenase catalytic domain-containing protein [Myxococcota bacterium]